MNPPTELLAMVEQRVLAHERRRRGVPSDAPALEVPVELPPLTLLAGRAFPPEVLERRLRFLRAMGWCPAAPSQIDLAAGTGLPEEASLDDHVAAIFGAASIVAREDRTASLAWSLGRPLVGREPIVPRAADLEAFLDARLGVVRDEPALASWEGASRWARLETAAAAGDRQFGRRRGRRPWARLAAGVAWLGEAKRRVRP